MVELKCKNPTVIENETMPANNYVYWKQTCTESDTYNQFPPGNLDVYTVYILEIFINCVLLNVIAAFGIIGNIINIIVLQKHGFRETTNILLVALSLFDLLCCVVLPVTRLKYIVNQFHESLAVSVNTFVAVYLFMPKYVCVSTSFSYVSIIAIERFVAVFFPFKVSRIFSSFNTKAIAIIAPVCCTISLTPTFLALTYKWTFDVSMNETIAVLEYTQFYRDHQAFLDFYAWVGLNIFFGCTSNVIITSCCVAIPVKLSRASTKRDLMTSRKTGYDVRVVKMLITVCIVFLAASTPNLALYSYFVPNFIFVSPINELVDNICVVFYAVNGSANFLVYVTMSKKFATTYKTLITCTNA